MVGPFEQAVLALMIFVIMLGMGAALTFRDITLALRRPQGLFIGLVGQYGIMPLIGLTLALVLPVPIEIKIGILIMGCMPGGTTSNIFTYFAKGNLALSVLMTVNSTIFGVLMIPLLLVTYTQIMLAQGYDVDVPMGNILVTLFLLLAPVAIGMLIRRLNANWGAVIELAGGALGVFFIFFLLVSWVPRNWQFLMETSIFTYMGAIGLGLLGFTFGYAFSALLRQKPRDCQTVAMEIGIQNGPLAIAIVVFTFAGAQQQAIMAVPALYSLFIVITSTLLTLWFRRVNDAAEQKVPSQLM